MAAALTLRLLRMHVGWIALWIPLWDRWLSLDKMLRKYTPKHPFALYRGVASDTIVELVLQRLQRPRMMRRRACYRRGLLLFYFLRLAKFRRFCILVFVHLARMQGDCMHTVGFPCPA